MARPVGRDLADAAGQPAGQRHAAGGCLQAQHGVAAVDHLAHGEGLDEHIVAARFDLRHVEHGIDQRQQMLARLVDQADIFALAVIAERAEIFMRENVRKSR